jgi:hypothetical protein
MDTFHATVLEGYWWGLDAYEIADAMLVRRKETTP